MDPSQPADALDLKGLPPRLRHLRQRIATAARTAFRVHAVRTYAVSITFTGDREIAGLNRRFLGRTGPTDVIAFNLSEAGLPYEVVGDVYISLDRARASSKTFKVGASEEIVRLVVHGVLHLVGYRDDGAVRRRKMESVQEEILRKALPRKRRAADAG